MSEMANSNWIDVPEAAFNKLKDLLAETVGLEFAVLVGSRSNVDAARLADTDRKRNWKSQAAPRRM